MQLQEIQDVFCDNSCLTDSLMEKNQHSELLLLHHNTLERLAMPF